MSASGPSLQSRCTSSPESLLNSITSSDENQSMLQGPSPDGVFSWRFVKQFISYASLCIALIVAPIVFNIPVELVLYVFAFILTEVIADNMVNHFLKLISNQTVANILFFSLLWFFMSLQANFIESLSIADDAKIQLAMAFIFSKINKILKVTDKIMTIISSFSGHINGPEAKYFHDDAIHNKALHMAKKAELPTLETHVAPISTLKAFAIPSENKVIIHQGIIDKLSSFNGILAHEVAHLKCSTIDSVMLKSAFHFSKALSSVGALVMPINPMGGASLALLSNYLYCNISQAEEERADRLACHLVENPEEVFDDLKELFKKNNKAASLFKYPLLHYPLAAKLLGIATHPSNEERLQAVENEINKMKPYN